MATVTGVLGLSPDFVRADIVLSTPVTPKTPTAQDPMPSIRGTVTNRLPVTASPQRSYAGSLQGRSVIDDYYEAIHVRPSFVEVGRLTSTVRRQVEVWNAYRDVGQLLERIDVTRGDGITVTGPALPYTLKRLESVTFTSDVTPEGPASIDARYDLVFPNATQAPFWRIIGTRIIEWSIPPNWADPVDETLSYKTEVLRAFDGSEQRIALRTRPRRTFAFTPLAAGRRSREMHRLLSTWQNRTYAMAYWPKGVWCLGGAPAGSVTVVLDEPLQGLQAGGIAVFRHGEGSHILEVDAVDGVTLTLNSPLTDPVEKDTRVFLGLNVHSEQTVSSRRLTSQVGQFRARFREMHIPERQATTAAPVTWRGLEVFMTPPNWSRSVDIEHEWNFDWVDSGRGPFDFRTPNDFPTDVRKMTFLATSRGAVDAIEAFYHRCRGRRGEFYMPTWDADVPLPGSVLGVGDLRLPVEDKADADRMNVERVYRNVVVRLSDGTNLYRQMYTGGDSPSGPGVLLDAGWPRDLHPGDVLAIHFLPRCRLASDDMTIRWLTDGKAEISLAYQVLPDIEEPQ